MKKLILLAAVVMIAGCANPKDEPSGRIEGYWHYLKHESYMNELQFVCLADGKVLGKVSDFDGEKAFASMSESDSNHEYVGLANYYSSIDSAKDSIEALIIKHHLCKAKP